MRGYKALWGVSLLAGIALAGPAQDLFDQATFYIGFNYYGYAKVSPFRELRQQYQPELDRLCGANREGCGYEAGLEVVQKIVTGLNDPFSGLYTKEHSEFLSALARGELPRPRIGVKTRVLPGQGLVVLEAYPGEPAFEAGLRRGDVIQRINGQEATPMLLANAEAKALSLSYVRQGVNRQAELTPAKVAGSMWPRYELLPSKVAHLRIPHFYGSIGQKVHDLIGKVEQAGAEAIVLDLRDSLSGFDNEALMAAGAFVPNSGYMYGARYPGNDQVYTTEKGKLFRKGLPDDELLHEIENPQLTKLPVVVLVNAQTENTAEMLAYFLQTAGRAKVVGEPSAGQLAVSGGRVAQLVNGQILSLSSLRMLHLDQRPFPARVTPDVGVKDDLSALISGSDAVLNKALELLRSKL